MKVKENSAADKLGLKPGDKILSINNLDCTDVSHEKVTFFNTLTQLTFSTQTYFRFKLND